MATLSQPFPVRRAGDLSSLARALIVRGLLAEVVGLFAILAPLLSLAAIALLFGAYALVDGIAAFATAVHAARHHTRAWPYLAQGALGVLVGIVALRFPPVTMVLLVVVVATWAVVIGALELAAAVRLRRRFRYGLRGEWLLGVNGALSILFGALLVFAPEVGLVAVPILFGAYAVINGVIVSWLGLRVRRLAHELA